jgi:hypothetical protein
MTDKIVVPKNKQFYTQTINIEAYFHNGRSIYKYCSSMYL